MQWPYAYQKSLVSFWDIPNLKRSWCRINNWPSTQWDWKVEGWNNHSLNVSDSGSIWHPSWECSGCSKLGQRDDIQSHCRIWWWIIPCQSECEEGATRLVTRPVLAACTERTRQWWPLTAYRYCHVWLLISGWSSSTLSWVAFEDSWHWTRRHQVSRHL